jgi:hypothetical protein
MWPAEGFERPKLTEEDMDKVLHELQERVGVHLAQYGDGTFMHPHELVGCMYGQQMKLSVASDASVYSGKLDEFRVRCLKTAMAILVGIASVDKLHALRSTGDSQDDTPP